MATYTDAELNAAADQQAARWAYVSVHTADPTTTGTAEASGGAPAYARKAPSFASAGTEGPLGPTLQPATAGVAWSALVTFDLPAGTYTHLGTWSAATAGTYRHGEALATPVVAAGQTQFEIGFGVGPVTP